ncbi:MAG: hypothetical protein ACR2KP_15505, partial [Egibacteraceae bacterium]
GFAFVGAVAFGVPVVAGDIPAVWGVGGDAVLWAPAESASLFAAAVRRVLGDAELAARLADQGRRQAARFDVTDTARAYEALFADLARARTYRERPSSPRAGKAG